MVCLLNDSNWTSLGDKLHWIDNKNNPKKRMKYLKMFSILLPSILIGCFGNKTTFEKNNQISKFGQPYKIEYFKHINWQAFKHYNIPTFEILNKTEIEEALQEIKSADNPEGADWDRIVLTFNDTIIKINTNKKKIGLAASGSFYDLKKNNFTKKRLNKK